MTISVVLATYNGERYLADQLDSLARQARLPDELVVADDASTDGTLDIVNDFAKSSPFPVKVSRNLKRMGWADNFLSAARLASGNLLAFCDQDDVWDASKLERTAAEFDHSDEVLLVAHHAQVVDSETRPVGRVFPRPIQAGHYGSNEVPFSHFPGLAITIRSCLFDFADSQVRPQSGFQPGLAGHDEWLWMIAACTGSIVVIPDLLVSYRQHQNNTFGERHSTRRDRLRWAWVTGADAFSSRAANALEVASYLDTLGGQWAANGQHKWAANAFDRANRYRFQAWRAARREHLYSAPTRWTALRIWAQIMCSGAYDFRASGRLAALSVAKDAAAILRRPHESGSKDDPYAMHLTETAVPVEAANNDCPDPCPALLHGLTGSEHPRPRRVESR